MLPNKIPFTRSMNGIRLEEQSLPAALLLTVPRWQNSLGLATRGSFDLVALRDVRKSAIVAQGTAVFQIFKNTQTATCRSRLGVDVVGPHDQAKKQHAKELLAHSR